MANQRSTKFFIVRHGETDWNKQGLMLSFTDIPLNAVGELQARELAKKLRHINFDAIFSSDLIRSKRTAEIIASERKLMVKTHKALRERSFGRFEGKDRRGYLKVIAKWSHLRNEEQFRHTAEGAMESLEQATSRLLNLLGKLSVKYAGKKLLVVSHGSVMRGLLIRLRVGTFETLPSGSILNTAYITVESDGRVFFIREMYGVNKKTP